MPTVNVWADNQVTCKARLKGMKYEKTSKVVFVFSEGSKKLGEVEAKVEKQGSESVAVAAWKALGPEGKQPWRVATYHLEIDGVAHSNFAQELYVWKPEVTIVAKGTDGKPFQGAVVALSQNIVSPDGRESEEKTRVERMTGEDGKINWRLNYPTDVKVELLDPYFLKDGKWDKDEGIHYEGTVERLDVKVKLTYPQVADKAKPHRQYVNVDPARNTPSHGSDLIVEVAAVGKAKPKLGAQAYLEATYDAKNSDRVDAKVPRKGETLELKSKFDRSGLAKFTVPLGKAGGNKVVIKVGGTPDCKDDQVTVESWRKLHYQITRPAGMATPDLQKLTAAMEKAKIALLPHDELEYPVGDGPKGTWVEGDDFGRGAGKKSVIGPQNSDYFHSKFTARERPVDLHFCFCHFQLDAKGTSSGTWNAEPGDTVTMPDGSSGVGFSLSGASSFGGRLLFPTDLATGKSALLSASWRSLSTKPAHAGKQGTFPADHVVIRYKGEEASNGKVFIKLPPVAQAVVDAGDEVEVKIKVAVAAGWYNGESVGHRLLIAGERRTGGGDIDAAGINGTMAHELGHAIEMTLASGYAVEGISVGDGKTLDSARAQHGRWYDSTRGHQGNHCANGVPQSDYDDNAKTMPGREGACVMYGEGWGARPNDYCDRCAPYIMAIDVSNVTK